MDEDKFKKEDEVPSVSKELESVKSNIEANKENQKVGDAELNQQKPSENPIKSIENHSEQEKDKNNKQISNKDVQNKVTDLKPADMSCDIAKVLDVKNSTQISTVIAEPIKNKTQSEKSNARSTVFTNVHLNRTNNVEIITKFQKVSNKEGQAIGMNIINQTVKKNASNATPITTTSNKMQGTNTDKIPVSNQTTKEQKQKPALKLEVDPKIAASNNVDEDEVKIRFMESIQLTRRNQKVVSVP